MSGRQIITGPDVPVPIGPYSQAVRAAGLVFVSGQPGTDPATGQPVLVADAADFPELNEAFAEAFPTDPPTRMTMQVPLPLGLLVSIGAVAIDGQK